MSKVERLLIVPISISRFFNQLEEGESSLEPRNFQTIRSSVEDFLFDLISVCSSSCSCVLICALDHADRHFETLVRTRSRVRQDSQLGGLWDPRGSLTRVALAPVVLNM